jgi:hypothetical protein
VILNFKNSEDYARKYLDLVNTFSKETGLKKKTTQNPETFLYTNNENTKEDIRKSIPFTRA